MKVKDLSTVQLEQLVALECQNILPILASVGIHLNPQNMREDLDAFKEDQVVLCEKNSIVDGFVVYSLRKSYILIKTFNLRQFNNVRILHNLLSQVFTNLENTSIEFINSQAHLTNKRSLNFHRKMGFKEIKANNLFIEFQISKDDLREIIQRRVLNH